MIPAKPAMPKPGRRNNSTSQQNEADSEDGDLDPVGHADEIFAADDEDQADDGDRSGQTQAGGVKLDIDAEHGQHDQDAHDDRGVDPADHFLRPGGDQNDPFGGEGDFVAGGQEGQGPFQVFDDLAGDAVFFGAGGGQGQDLVGRVDLFFAAQIVEFFVGGQCIAFEILPGIGLGIANAIDLDLLGDHGLEQRGRILVFLGGPLEGGADEAFLFFALDAFERIAHQDRGTVADGGVFEHDDVAAGDADHRAGADGLGGDPGDGAGTLADIEDEVLGDIVGGLDQAAIGLYLEEQVAGAHVEGLLAAAAKGLIEAVVDHALAGDDHGQDLLRSPTPGSGRTAPRIVNRIIQAKARLQAD